jgi:hypothetical protein
VTQAEELACAGKYADARALYKRIARDYAGTPAGRMAEARTRSSAFLGACPLVDHGPSSNRVDVVVLGDGFQEDHLRALEDLAGDVPPLFERVEPFREYWDYFDFQRGVCASADAGVDGFGRHYDTLFGGFTLPTDIGHVGLDAERVRAVLAQIPGSDGIAIVLVKLGVSGTGSPGIAVIGGGDAKTTIHEFGHAFTDLGDEYSDHTHNRGAVREALNISATDDVKRVPWRHWLEKRHPGVGVYEGAAGQPMNAWRPTASGCIMNDGDAFCPVCREALVLRIYSIVDPIDQVDPPAPPPGIREPLVFSGDALEIRVRTMRPARHDLGSPGGSSRRPSTRHAWRARSRAEGAPASPTAPRAAAAAEGRPADPARAHRRGRRQRCAEAEARARPVPRHLPREGHDRDTRREVPLGPEGRPRPARERARLVGRGQVSRALP